MLNGSESAVSESLKEAVLNRTAVTGRKCISREAVKGEKMPEMIAGYLADLIKEQYSSILN